MNGENEEDVQELSKGFWKKVRVHLGNAERISKYAGTGVIIFGLIATGGGILASSTTNLTTLSASTVGILGAILAVICAFIQKLLEKDHIDLLESAKVSLDRTQAYLYQRNELFREIEDMQRLDAQRLQMQSAFGYMLEHTEQALAAPTAGDVKTSLDGLLDLCQAELLAAMGMTYADKMTISVYQVVQEPGEPEPLLKILCNRKPNKAEEQEHLSRSWPMGQGYSGHAWLQRNEVIIPDSMQPGVQSGFHTPQLGEQSEGDLTAELKRYRSVASVPIFVGGDTKVWGVVSVTTNQANKFSTNVDDDVAAQNVETVRILAKMIAVLVVCCAKTNQGSSELPHSDPE